MRAILLGFGSLAMSALGFGLGLHVTFPDDLALKRLQWEIQDRSRDEWALAASDLDLWMFTGVSLDDATLYKVKKSRFRRNADNEKPPEINAFLHFDRLRARLQPSALLQRGLMVSYNADLYGGALSGSAGVVGDEQRIAAELEGLDLGQVPMAGDGWTIALSGRANLDTDLTLNSEEVKESKGHLDLSFDQLGLVSGDMMGLKLEPMAFSKAKLGMEVADGVAKVTEGTFTADQLELVVSGDITLAKELRRSRLRLALVLTLGENLDKLAHFVPTMNEARQEDGSYHFTYAGTPGLARLRPDRAGSRGTSGPLGGGNLPQGGMVGDEMMPRGPGMGGPGMDRSGPGMDGPEGPGELGADEEGASADDDAEARRQRRLERIRKARERRAQREAERRAAGEDGPTRPRIQGGEGEPMDPRDWQDEPPPRDEENEPAPEDNIQEEGYDPFIDGNDQ